MSLPLLRAGWPLLPSPIAKRDDKWVVEEQMEAVWEKRVRRLVDKQREVLRQTVPVGNGSEEPAEIRGGDLRKRGKPQGGHQLGLLMKQIRCEWNK